MDGLTVAIDVVLVEDAGFLAGFAALISEVKTKFAGNCCSISIE